MIHLRFVRQFGFFTMLIYTVLTIIRVNNNVVIAYIGSKTFNFIQQKSFEGFSMYLIICILGQATVTIGKIFHARMTNKLHFSYLSDLRMKLFESVSANPAIRNQEESHEYLSTFTTDIEQLEKKYVGPKFEMIIEIWLFIISLVVSCFYDVTVTLIVAVVSFSALLVPHLFKTSTKQLGNNLSSRQKEYIKVVNDFLSGISTIKIFKMIPIVKDKYRQAGTNMDQANTEMSNKLDDALAVNNIISTLSYMLISVIGAYFIIFKNLKIGSYIAIIQLSNTLTMPVESIAGFWNEIHSTAHIREKIAGILSGPKEEGRSDKLDFEHHFVYEINNLCYQVDKLELFDHLSKTIKQGEKVLLLGESGSGKSTLVELLIGNKSNYSGNIKLFGRDVRLLNHGTRFEQIAWIEQEPFIFNESILFNITLGKEYSEKEIEEAIIFAALEDVIEEKGLAYIVGERGNLLSGGQKQRLNIARAFLIKRPIFIFDEATSALDQKTASRIEKNILTLDATIFFISHNPRNIHSFSDIIKL